LKLTDYIATHFLRPVPERGTLPAMQTLRSAPVHLLLPLLALNLAGPAKAATPKVHTVSLGPVRKVPYTPPDTSANAPGTDGMTLKVRPLVVDGRQREWTTGDTHEVTDRSFTVRRALRINDSLPGESAARWVWQPGPWLLVDRSTGHIAALHLPEFDAMVSDVVWFRDYAAYCGVATTAKGGLDAVVAQLGAKKAVVRKQIAPWPPPERQPDHAAPPCKPPVWQREPLRITMQPAGGEPMIFDVVGTASIVEEGDGEDP
jgi:hypothetical protein